MRKAEKLRFPHWYAQENNENSAFRPLYIQKTYNIYNSVHRYDDIHVNIRCS